jgi:hypothetical protein
MLEEFKDCLRHPTFLKHSMYNILFSAQSYKQRGHFFHFFPRCMEYVLKNLALE